MGATADMNDPCSDRSAAASPASPSRPPRSARGRWRRLAAALVASALLASCGGGSMDFFGDLDDDLTFYADTAVTVNPGGAELTRGQQTTAMVTVRHKGEIDQYPSLTVLDPAIPGVAISLVPMFQHVQTGYRHCGAHEIPAGEDPAPYYCYDWQLIVAADASATHVGRLTLSALWGGRGGMIERVAHFDVNLVGLPASGTPDYALAVVPLAKVYAPRGAIAVTVARQAGFAADVHLSLDAMGSEITGTFTPNPVPAGVSTAQLLLEMPAHMAGGYFTQLKVNGSGGGIDRSWQFGQLVDPLYTVKLATSDGGPAVLTPTQPLDLEVTITFDPYGPFSVVGPGRIDLSLPDPPPGVTVQWLPDARPTSVMPAELVLRRTLRLSGARDALNGDLKVRATAAQLPTDSATPPAAPFVEAKLPIRVDPALAWEYVSNGAAYDLNVNDAIGIGMQSDNRPAVAWMEGPSSGDKWIYVKRFDGTSFVPSPPSTAPDHGGMTIPGRRIEQARMAMSGNDDANVAFTYRLNEQEGGRVGRAVNRRVDGAWIVNDEVFSLPPEQHARSPRIAAGLNDQLALSYLVETGIPAGAGLLLVRSRLAAGPLVALPGPQIGDSINVSSSGQVLRDTPSIALAQRRQPVAGLDRGAVRAGHAAAARPLGARPRRHTLGRADRGAAHAAACRGTDPVAGEAEQHPGARLARSQPGAADARHGRSRNRHTRPSCATSAIRTVP